MIPNSYLVDGCLQTDQGLVELAPWVRELVLMLENTKDSREPIVMASRKLIYEAGAVLKQSIPYSVPPEYTTYDDPPPNPPKPAKPTKAREIREWANNNGYNLKGKGRIPVEVMHAYEEAHA